MKVEEFLSCLGADFYTGVPDSQLKAVCNYLMDTYGLEPQHHIIGANEGNCVALAAGYHLATGKVPVVYLQNSGEGNIVNPVASLLHEQVYGLPCIFLVGWRGEPGVHDEPQHVFQGQITLPLLELLGVQSFVLDKDTTLEEVQVQMAAFCRELSAGRQVAFVVRKGALSYGGKPKFGNSFAARREEIIGRLAAAAGEAFIVSTTGKASRELFEIREARGEGHGHDFLTVGSMGHASSLALGMALQRPERQFICLDGDGAALMHLGAMAVIGAKHPANLLHIVINNQAHESVGGQPTVAGCTDLCGIARACGYPWVAKARTLEEVESAFREAMAAGQCAFIEAEAAIGARADLGRPTSTPQENKQAMMAALQGRGLQEFISEG